MKKNFLPLAFWLVFEAIAVILWLTQDALFYLFNFSYIGTCLAIGFFLVDKKFKYGRNVVQFAVGIYLFGFVGLLWGENMQIEGFWYFLFLGIFQAAVIHYVVAKIFGPFLFGRGWCGYACWTAMILDILPYKIPQEPRRKIGFIKYILFVASFIFVGALFVLQVPNIEKIMFWSFIIGNILYYAVGISLAFAFKDNRAFCKYICPITTFLKPASYYSVLRVKIDAEKCVSCGKCRNICPMNVDMTDNSRRRINGTECILCFQCIDACPKKALHI